MGQTKMKYREKNYEIKKRKQKYTQRKQKKKKRENTKTGIEINEIENN